MSDLLARFQAQTRRKADSDLIRRWEWDARYHGDKNIKIQALPLIASVTILGLLVARAEHWSITASYILSLPVLSYLLVMFSNLKLSGLPKRVQWM